MNSNETVPPAFPEKRTSQLRSKWGLYLLAIFMTAGLAITSGLLSTVIGDVDSQNGTKRVDGLFPVLVTMLLALGFAGGLVWSVKFWRTIDEAARRAHLDAFYWGGPISWMVIAPFCVLPLKIKGFELPIIETLDMSASQIFGLGVAATIAVTMIGYGIAWIIWWAIKR